MIGESREEVWIIAQIARYYADNAERFLAPTPIKSALGDAWVEHHPIGVLVAVEPWNFPYYQLMRVLAPALAAGNPGTSETCSDRASLRERVRRNGHSGRCSKGSLDQSLHLE